MGEMRALTLVQPWAWAIADAGKTVENRSWKTAYRGLLAIHAGASLDEYDVAMPTERAARKLGALRARAKLANAVPAEAARMRLSRIVAVADLYGIHHAHDCAISGDRRLRLCSQWAVPGHYHWLLRDVRPLPDPVPCRGMLGLWRLPEDVEKLVREQLSQDEKHG